MRVGLNSRLDTIQAAILIEKLKIFPDELEMRGAVAARYASGLEGSGARAPIVIDGGLSTWAQYTIEHPDRDGLAAHLKALGVPTAAYYPMPMHVQGCYSLYPRPGGLPVSEARAEVVLALPMHPYLDAATQDRIIEGVRSFGG
jgi:dTDP-4-amino-4,6-dideoxygalactose transaminase